jgi:hypothetical protein
MVNLFILVVAVSHGLVMEWRVTDGKEEAPGK